MSYILSIGEILGRFTTENNKLIKNSTEFSFNYGGTEANVLISLSSLGEKCVFISRLPNNSFGEGAVNLLKEYSINVDNITFDNELNLGFYFVENACSSRERNVVYNRKNTAITNINIKDYSLREVVKCASLFHFSGISLVLSESLREMIRECLKFAKEFNIPVSFDFNYRRNLLSVEEAKKLYKEFILQADYVFASSWDLKTFLDLKEEDERLIFEKSCEYYKYIFTKHKTFIEPNKQKVTAYCYSKNYMIQSKEFEFEYIDKIGAGDAFSAGILFGVLNKLPIEKTLEFGIANLALVQSKLIDYSTFKIDELEEFIGK